MKIQKMRDQNICVCVVILNWTEFKTLVSELFLFKELDPYIK